MAPSTSAATAIDALDAATGRLRWSYTTADIDVSNPVVTGGTVYVSSYDGSVYALSAGS